MAKTVGEEFRPPHVRSPQLAAIQQAEWELQRMQAHLADLEKKHAKEPIHKFAIREKKADIARKQAHIAELKAKAELPA